MACTPVNKPTKTGLVGQPSESAAQRRRAYSVQRTGDQLVDRNLDLIQQALREENRGLVDIENVMPALLEAAGIVGTGTGVDDSTDLGTTPITDLTEGTIRFVGTFRSFFRLDKTNSDGWTADGISYISALGGIGMWVRLPIADPYWATQTAWYIDPAQTNAQPGDDENSGLLTTAPLRSTAEWRRRVAGANFDNVIIVIRALSSSTVEDDGIFTGFTTHGSGQIVLLGTTSVLRTGTVTGYVAYSGNVRGQLTDSAIPVSWTASDSIATTAGSRYIRKTGTFKQAPLGKDLGSKTVQIGLPVTISETDASAFPDVTTTDFIVGDSYEVVTRPHWPLLIPGPQVFVRYQCIDCTPGTTLPGIASTAPHVMRTQYVLCGFLGAGSVSPGFGLSQCDACVFTGSGFGSGGQFSIRSCIFVDSLMQFNLSPTNINLSENVFVGSELRVWHGGLLASSGTLRVFDSTTSCLSVRHNSSVNLQSLVGSGNTGKLIVVNQFGTVHGGANATATTSDPLPFEVAGTSYATPVVSAGTGDGIYN